MAARTPTDKVALLRRVLSLSDDELALARDTTKLLGQEIGPLMSQVSASLTRGEGLAELFDDDFDRASAFKNAMTQFALKATAADFTDAYCVYVAGLEAGLEPRAPCEAFHIVAAVIAAWIVETLVKQLEGDTLAKTLSAWQKVIALNVSLYLSGGEEPSLAK